MIWASNKNENRGQQIGNSEFVQPLNAHWITLNLCHVSQSLFPTTQIDELGVCFIVNILFCHPYKAPKKCNTLWIILTIQSLSFKHFWIVYKIKLSSWSKWPFNKFCLILKSSNIFYTFQYSEIFISPQILFFLPFQTCLLLFG